MNVHTSIIGYLGEQTTPTVPLHIWLYTSQTQIWTLQTQNTQLVIHSCCRWFRSQLLYTYWHGPSEQRYPNKIHNNKRYHRHNLLWTHPGMGLSTSIHRYFHTSICRQGPVLFLNVKDATSIHTTLDECIHPQYHTLVHNNNKYITSIADVIIKQKRPNAVDMILYWIRERVRHGYVIARMRLVSALPQD